MLHSAFTERGKVARRTRAGRRNLDELGGGCIVEALTHPLQLGGGGLTEDKDKWLNKEIRGKKRLARKPSTQLVISHQPNDKGFSIPTLFAISQKLI